MGHIAACLEAHELTSCKQGANEHAHMILLKAMKGPKDKSSASPQPSGDPAMPDLDAAAITKAATEQATSMIAKTILWNDVTKAHFGALVGEAQSTFLAKTAEEQNAEAAAAKKVIDDAITADAAKAAGVTAETLELRKTVATQSEQLKALQDKDAERDLQKRASTEFDGYPGGADVLVPLLKSAAGLPADQKKTFEAGLLATAVAAKASTAQVSLTVDEVNKTMPASAEIEKVASERAEANGTTAAVEKAKMASEPAFSAKMAKAMEEQGAN